MRRFVGGRAAIIAGVAGSVDLDDCLLLMGWLHSILLLLLEM